MQSEKSNKTSFFILSKKRQKSKNIFLTTFLVIFIGGYLFFFTSKSWLITDNDLINATKLGAVFNYEDAEISVNRWEYSEKQHIMEVQLDIKNNSLANNSIFTYDAVERSKGILTVEAVVDEQDFIVLRIKDIPDKWREISLRLQKNKSSDPLKLYTNKNSIDYVDSLKNLSELEYRILNIESIISGYQEDIVGLNKKIKKLQDNIDTIQNNISDLEKEKEYQTKQEQTNTDTLISAAESDISNYETEIQECKNTISEYTERIENAEQKKSDLQHSH